MPGFMNQVGSVSSSSSELLIPPIRFPDPVKTICLSSRNEQMLPVNRLSSVVYEMPLFQS